MKLYAYCLCADHVMLDKPVSGVSGAAVRVLNIEDMSVLVSDCESVAANQESALAHAAVVQSILDKTTLLPFRFWTIVTEEQLRRYVATYNGALKKKFEQLVGCVQMDLKVIWRRGQPITAPPEQQQATGPGTAFLREKQRELQLDERAAAQRAELSILLGKELGGVIRDEGMGLRPSDTVAMGKVFHLVESSKIKEYREKVQILLEKHPELELEVIGPLPPYSFANIELEFGSQFGVS